MAAPPIQRLAPSRIQVSPSAGRTRLRAVVDSPPAMSEPDSGSVSEKTPLSEKSMTLGIHSACCSAEAPTRMAVRNSPAWAVYQVASEASVRASSKIRKPW